MSAKELFEYRDGDLYRKVKTNVGQRIGQRIGWTDKDGYRRHEVNGVSTGVHRTIFFLHHGYVPKVLDHINGVRSDNRIENLREATLSQNQHNTKLRKDSTTGVKNVTYERGLYRVRITVNKRVIDLGRYADLELAEFIADEAREKYHGEYTRRA